MEEFSNDTVHLCDTMILIEGCKNGDRESQRLLYRHHYVYCMSICIRYAHSQEEAKDILNDGFMKVFSKIHLFDPAKSLKGWMRRIMINTAIDHFRNEKKHYYHSDISDYSNKGSNSNVIDDLSYNEIIELVHGLSPMYRMVFSLYVIEGYTHDDISRKLGISIGTSKSNLSKARGNLRKMLVKTNKELYEQYS